jgi:hypothetical protein
MRGLGITLYKYLFLIEMMVEIKKKNYSAILVLESTSNTKRIYNEKNK